MVRGGCWRVVLEAEVAAYVDAHADQADAVGRRLVVRNGSAAPREVAHVLGSRPLMSRAFSG